MNFNESLIPRKDFYKSLDISEIPEIEFIDLEECEIIYLNFIEYESSPLKIIFKNFKSSYTELHKTFLIEKIENLEISEDILLYIINDGSFDTFDLLNILPVSFYKIFIRFLSNKNYLFFMDTLLDIQQVCDVFKEENIWDPFPWYYNMLNDKDLDIISLYKIMKKIICLDYKIKNNFMLSINNIISKNQERNKIIFDEKKCVSDIFAHNLNKLCNKFMEIIINKKMYDKISLRKKDNSFTNLVFRSKVEIFKLSYIKIIEERKRLKMEGERFNHLDLLLKDIKEEESFGHFIGDIIIKDKGTEEDDFVTNTRSSYLYIFDILPTNSSTYNILKYLFEIDIHKQQILGIIVHNSHLIKFSLLNSIIDYYNKIQKESHKVEIRYLINIILVEDKSFSKLKICSRNIKFINNLMSDFEYFLSQGLTGISEINKLLKKEIEENDFQKIKDHIFYVRIIRDRVSCSFIFVETCFNLLNHIIKFNVEILLVDELINIFVKILNCNLKTIVGPKCSNLVLKNPHASVLSKNKMVRDFCKTITNASLKFNPKELLRNILLIYIGIKDIKFIKGVCNEEMYYDINIFENGLEICENKYILNSEHLRSLKYLIEKLKKNRKEKEEESDDEFIDPLTYNSIKDPIKLLTSNVTIDKSTYNMIMLNDGIDPFNREPIDETKIKVDDEMLKKINEKKKK